MLIRISLIVAIVAALATGIINFVKVKEKIDTVVAERNEWNQKWVATDAELTTTKSDLAKTTKELDKTKETLAQTEQARAAAVAEVDTLAKKSAELTDKLNLTFKERDEARANLAAYEATGYRPEQIAALGRQIREAQEALEVSKLEKDIIQRRLAKVQGELDWLRGTNVAITMRADLKGKVMVADPKWDFVVLNVGEEGGAKMHGELLVSRAGKLVGKVIIKDLQKDRSIANVVPGWKLDEVIEGDVVIPAHPES